MLSMPILPLPRSGPRRLNFTVREVTGWYERRRFARFAARLYRNDRYWAPAVVSERMRALDPKKNPVLARIPLGLFMGESRTLDETVGTIAVWIEPEQPAGRQARRFGSFGLLEAINEGAVVTGLLEAAEKWVREHLRGAAGLRGPLELDAWRSPGVLVDGYNDRPGALMPYNPPYYAELVETAGCTPGAEMLAYQLDLAALEDAGGVGATRLHSEALAVAAGHDLVVRETTGELDRASAGEPGQRLQDGAWRIGLPPADVSSLDLIGRLNELAARHPAATLLVVEDSEDGAAAAFGAAVPNAGTPALIALGTRLAGRWRARPAEGHGTASRGARRAGVRLLPAIIRTDRLDWDLEGLLLSELLRLSIRRGYARAEVSPVPAGDRAARDRLEALGARPIKAYRIYEKRF
jgi:hypothetical protein